MADSGQILVSCPACGKQVKCTVTEWTAGFPCAECDAIISRPAPGRPRVAAPSGKGPIVVRSRPSESGARRAKTAHRVAVPVQARPSEPPVAAPASETPVADPVDELESLHSHLATETRNLERELRAVAQQLGPAASGARRDRRTPGRTTSQLVPLAEVRTLQAEIRSLSAENAALQAKVRDLGAEKHAAVQGASADLSVLEAENEVLKEKFDQLVKDRVNLSTQLAGAKAKLEHISKRNRELSEMAVPPEKMQEIHGKLKSLMVESRVAKDKLGKVVERYKDQFVALQKAEKGGDLGKQQIAKLSDALAKLKTSRQKLAGENQELAKQLSTLRQTLVRTAGAAKAAKEKLAAVERDREAEEARRKADQDAARKAEQERAEAAVENSRKLEIEVKVLREKIHHLVEELGEEEKKTRDAEHGAEEQTKQLEAARSRSEKQLQEAAGRVERAAEQLAEKDARIEALTAENKRLQDQLGANDTEDD